jgi:Flagellar hook-length control protein FliK
MKIQPVLSSYNPRSDRDGFSQCLDIFRLGRIIETVTLTSSTNGHLLLRVGDKDVIAYSNTTLPKNKRLSFRVTQVTPQVMLKFISPIHEAAIGNSIKDAMLTMLPLQNKLTTLLVAMSSPSFLEESSNFVHSFRSLVSEFISALPVRQSLFQADSLRQTILQSGLFLEARLASLDRKTSNNPADMKILLLRLIHGLDKLSKTSGISSTAINAVELLQQGAEDISPHNRQLSCQPRVSLNTAVSNDITASTIAVLLKKAQGALARLVLHQIFTAENVDEGQHLWRLEIPVCQNDEIDVVSISIEREQADNTMEEAQSWVIDLALDLPSMGPVNVRSHLYQQSISTTFWCKTPKTLALVKSRLTQLKTRLNELGLKSLGISCHAGIPPTRSESAAEITLVDQHA